MKWFINLRQRNKIALLFAFVFALILVKNALDKKQVTDLGKTFSAVYEDRLLAESYIYRISDQLYREKLQFDKAYKKGDAGFFENAPFAEAITSLVADFDKTRLTEEESRVFKSLKFSISHLHILQELVNDDMKQGVQNQSNKQQLDDHFDHTLSCLNALSEIQVREGKGLNESSMKIVAGNAILTQFELAFLVIVGILIQTLIFASRGILPGKVVDHTLN